jgi:hypothetical protein
MGARATTAADGKLLIISSLRSAICGHKEPHLTIWCMHAAWIVQGHQRGVLGLHKIHRTCRRHITTVHAALWA